MTRIAWFTGLALFATNFAFAQYQRLSVIHGVAETCRAISNLDRALASEDTNFFAGWTNADYNAATQWAEACVAPGYGFMGAGRAARIRAYQAKVARPITQTAAAPIEPLPKTDAEIAADQQRLA
jgi:hypothetical protein